MTGSRDADRERGMGGEAGGGTNTAAGAAESRGDLGPGSHGSTTDPAGDVGDIYLAETDEAGSGAGGRIPSATTGGATRVTGTGIGTTGGAAGGTTSGARTGGVGDTGAGDHLTGGLLDQEPGGAPVVRGTDDDDTGDAGTADDTSTARPAGE